MANRHKARESALEVLYAWSSSGDDTAIAPLLADRLDRSGRQNQDQDFLRASVTGVAENVQTLDAIITAAMQNRGLKHLGRIELSVLRLAAWEMSQRLEIPCRVIINEALQLTRTYADEVARSFVNGVLDRMARQLRQQEFTASRG